MAPDTDEHGRWDEPDGPGSGDDRYGDRPGTERCGYGHPVVEFDATADKCLMFETLPPSKGGVCLNGHLLGDPECDATATYQRLGVLPHPTPRAPSLFDAEVIS